MRKFYHLLLMTCVYSFSAHAQPLMREKAMKLENENNTIKIFQENVSSVVNVSNIRLARRGFFDLDPMEIPTGAGSGFVWDNQGHIVTNFHVIANGESFLVSFNQDPKHYEAILVGSEPRQDIAVLKLKELPPQLKPIKAGDSKSLQVGQKALAIGNPFGLDHTITEGIVSALDREILGIGDVKIRGMIQTDSSINPGNSGGPLLDSQGEVIGMNTMIYSKSGTSAGIGFAVPISSINRIVPQIIKHGKVIRPGLGIGVLPDHQRRRFGVETGIIVTFLDEKGPAAKAGIQGISQDRRGRYFLGDVVVGIDDNKIDNFDDIYHVLDQYKIGDEVEVSLMRDGKLKKVKLKLTEI